MALIDDIRGLDCSLRPLRSFGVTMAAIGVIVSAWLGWREIDSWPWWLGVALVLAVVGWIVPSCLRPFYRVWMTIALVLGWITTRVVLTVVFYLVVTPTALIARLSGKRFIDLRPDPGRESYWIEREKSDRDHHEQYEQQF